jgi:hypothetical protein
MSEEKIYLEDIQSEDYDRNLKRYGENYDTCIMCGRRTKVEFFIHMKTSGEIIPADIDDETDSQGLFPVGPECKKRLSMKFLIKK